MNKTKIEWVRNPDGTQGYTWNPVTGCLHGCSYCYAHRINQRFGDGKFEPTFYPNRLQDPLKVKKPSRIFVGSMADLFGDWEWVDKSGGFVAYSLNVINSILNIADQCPQHTFIFLTKNPRGMQGFDFPANCWCGTSVENQERADEKVPELLRVNCETLFVSYEPALGPVDLSDWLDGCGSNGPVAICKSCGIIESVAEPFSEAGDFDIVCEKCGSSNIDYSAIDWLIIGAQTGPGAVRPPHAWISSAIQQARNANVSVFVKDNVMWPEVIREWPGVRE